VLKAAYEIPICVSLVFLVVQGVRVTLSDLLDRVVRGCDDNPEQNG